VKCIAESLRKNVLRTNNLLLKDLKCILLPKKLDQMEGSLLITHPVSCMTQQAFHRSIITLSHISKKENEHILGWCINKPLPHRLKDVLMTKDFSTLEPFLNNKLFLGGIIDSPLTCIHRCSDAPDSFLLGSGWYSNFITTDKISKFLCDKITKHGENKKEFIFTFRYACWATEQLVSELERNIWFLCKSETIIEKINVALFFY